MLKLKMSYSEIKKFCRDKKVMLVAVSKTQPNSIILKMYDKGQRIFGENKVQELVDKYEALPKDIKWQMIGHLQRNKVKYIVKFVDLIQSVDSLSLLVEINKHAKKAERQINVLLQFHIAEEESKFGLSWSEAEALLKQKEGFLNINFCGVMGMASFTEDKEQVNKEFATLRNHFNVLKSAYFAEDDKFKIISMGMSGDYESAVEQGSNMVRIGSLLFGNRNY